MFCAAPLLDDIASHLVNEFVLVIELFVGVAIHSSQPRRSSGSVGGLDENIYHGPDEWVKFILIEGIETCVHAASYDKVFISYQKNSVMAHTKSGDSHKDSVSMVSLVKSDVASITSSSPNRAHLKTICVAISCISVKGRSLVDYLAPPHSIIRRRELTREHGLD